MTDTNTFQLSRYETWELDAMVTQIERPDPWLLRTFFRRVKMFDSKQIEFDIVDRGRRLAPFVAPMVAGKPTRRDGFRTRSLQPAYIKPYDIVKPGDGFTRQPGEPYGGKLTPQQRFDRVVAEKLNLYDEMVENRLEWMAAQALVYGRIIISGEDYPAVTVDFGRDASLNVALTGAARWTQGTSTPMTDIENAALNVRRISKGAIVTDLVMDGQSWTALRAHAAVQDLINEFYRRSLPGQTQSAIDMGPRSTLNEAQLVGTLAGRFNLWVYDSYYQDDAGADQPFIPPYTVLGLSAALEGTQYFGAIEDLDAGMQPSKLFVKSKVKFNPSGLELVGQSAPLVAPRRPNAQFTLTVS